MNKKVIKDTMFDRRMYRIMTMATSNFINKGKFFFELVFQSLIVYFFYLDDDKKASINLDESNVKRKFSQRYKDR